MATTDLGKWMITNGGDYDPDVTYEKLTMVMYDNSTYITLKTVTGVTPSNDQINYALMARGFNPGVLSSVTAVDTSGALGTAGETVSAQSLVDYLANAVMTKLVEKANISNVQVNDSSKVPSAALAYAMQQQITENEDAISGLSSDMEIEILTSSDSILEFIVNNKRAKQGFVVESGYPTDAPENIEAFVIVNRDQTGNRVLVEFRPYGFATRNYSYFRSAFNGEWQQPEWTKMEYALKDDLDNNLARAALSYNLLAPCDRPTFLQWIPETLNTPYKAGLTSSSYGFAFVYGSYTSQMVLFAMALGTYEIFVCTVNNGQSSTWKKINPDSNP